MKPILTGIIFIVVLVYGFTWLMSASKEEATFFEPRSRQASVITQAKPQPDLSQSKSGGSLESAVTTPEGHLSHSLMPVISEGTSDDTDGFPAPTVQIVNGRPERTIHMGVRQYAWDPPVIEAKYGELIRLIVHNADVQHGLVIPDLNVLNIDIPPDGAVIEFKASKVGTFPFFCSYYCGEDHSIMRGKIVIE